MFTSLAAGAVLAASVAAAPETAEYRVSFTGAWTPQSHPTDYPGSAHFSPLIGGVHAAPGQYWSAGALASPGIEQMAETGGKTLLRNAVLADIDAGLASEVIESFSIIGSTGVAVDTFTASQTFPYATVVTMIAPSPDWFVGVSGVNLFVDGAWADEIEVLLQPYDAGTDSGVTFTSPNQDTQPPELIGEIFGFPFAAPGDAAAPIGVLRFVRTDVIDCPTDFDESGVTDAFDLAAVLAAWGTAAAEYDLDGDGLVGAPDLAILLAAWGACG